MASQKARQSEFLATVAKRVPELRGEFTLDSTDAQHQERLKSELALIEQRLGDATTGLSDAGEKLEQHIHGLIEEFKNPLALIVTMGSDGVPTKIERLLSEAP